MEDIKQGIYVGELTPTRLRPRVRQGVWTGELTSTRLRPRVRVGFGLHTNTREIIIEDNTGNDIGDNAGDNTEDSIVINQPQTPRAFPLEISWTKNN